MNAKHNPCMRSSRRLLLLGALFCAQLLPAQDLWRGGRNVAGVAQGPETGHFAGAALFGKFTSGEFRSPSHGKTLFATGVAAESESRFQNLYLAGNFGFELDYGTQMMGSMFTAPGYYPVDMLEFTPGPKVRQTYDIGGALAWKNSSRWTPGTAVRFRGVNYAKRKDLRHTTYRQELELAPSVHYRGEGWQAGLSLVFEKTSEFIKAEQVGEAPIDPYMAFLDKGIRYGTLEIWDGNGTHLNETGVNQFPVKEYTWGFAVQASLGEALYGDFEFDWTSGQVGEKGYTWFRFPGHKLSAQIVWTLPSATGVHSLQAAVEWFRQSNYETVLEKSTHGGVTTPEEYGSRRIFQRMGLEAGPSWSFSHKKGWGLGSSLQLIQARDRSTLMYPYLDNDESLVMRWSVQGRVPLGNFLLQAGALAGCKIGEHRHTVEVADPSLGLSSTPYRLQDWWDREQEANDATRIQLMLSVRYNFVLGHSAPLYLEAGCNWLHAFDIQLLSGSDRQTTYLKLGYNFN